MSTSATQRAEGTDDYADGQAIAAARKACRLTQAELARKAAVSLSQLRKVEQGSRTLTPGVRTTLAAALGPARHASPDPTTTARIARALPLLGEAMKAYDIPPEPLSGTPPLPELDRLTRTATTWRLGRVLEVGLGAVMLG